jgi:hypothetical protein
MPSTKYLKGECQHCAGHIEFPAESIGTIVPCPHCGRETELRLATPPVEPTVPRRVVVWTLITILVLVAGLVAVIIGLKYYQAQTERRREQAAAAAAARKAAEVPPVPPPPILEETIAKAGFHVSNITLEKTPGSSLVYAVGTVNNTTDRQRFGMRIEMDLFGADGQKLGTATDYQSVIEAQAQWKFKALVVDSKAVSVKLASLKEDQK